MAILPGPIRRPAGYTSGRKGTSCQNDITSQWKDLKPAILHCIDNSKTKMLYHFQLWEICSFFSFFGPQACGKWRQCRMAPDRLQPFFASMQSWRATEKAKGDMGIMFSVSNHSDKILVNSYQLLSIHQHPSFTGNNPASSLLFPWTLLLQSESLLQNLSATCWWSHIVIVNLQRPIHRRRGISLSICKSDSLCSFANEKLKLSAKQKLVWYKQWCKEHKGTTAKQHVVNSLRKTVANHLSCQTETENVVKKASMRRLVSSTRPTCKPPWKQTYFRYISLDDFGCHHKHFYEPFCADLAQWIPLDTWARWKNCLGRIAAETNA